MSEVWTSDGICLRLEDLPARRGGESRVYRGRDPQDRELAVKVALLPLPHGAWLEAERRLLEDLGRDPALHDHIVDVRYHGLWLDRPFLAMDWYPASLDSLLPGLPDLSRRLTLAVAVAEVVAVMHAARPRLVHGDIKPSNVLLDAQGRLRLADFGASHEPMPGHTTTTTVLYSPTYAAPEQRLPGPGRPERSWDVYALAATLFAILVGRPPRAPTRNALCLTANGQRLLSCPDLADRSDTVPLSHWLDFSQMSALLPEDWEALSAVVVGPILDALRRAMAPDPRHRRGDARSLALALSASRPRRVRSYREPPRLWLALAGPVLLLAGHGGGERERGADLALPDYPMLPREGYLIGAQEVSQGLWRAVTGEAVGDRRRFSQEGLGGFCDDRWTQNGDIPLTGEELPMICVSWLDAVRFANQLSEREGLPLAYTITVTGSGWPEVRWDREATGYRLPTVAELMQAALAGGEVLPEGGEGWCTRENHLSNEIRPFFPHLDVLPCDDGFAGLAPVDAMEPSAGGLHHVLGNVREWTWDTSSLEQVDPRYAIWGPTREAFGGDWRSAAGGLSGGFPADWRLDVVGLRLVRGAP